MSQINYSDSNNTKYTHSGVAWLRALVALLETRYNVTLDLDDDEFLLNFTNTMMIKYEDGMTYDEVAKWYASHIKKE